MAVVTLRDELRAAVESRHSRHHPFYQLWREGKLSREAIGGWVQEHYHFTKDVLWLEGALLIDVPYADVREQFRRGIFEEEMDPADPHIAILLRFGEAMGLDPKAVRRSKPLPTTQALLDWAWILTRHRSMVEAIAGLNIGLESQPPQLYGDIVPVLKEQYGCTDEQLKYFRLHVEADTEHGARAYALVEKYARTEEQRRRAVLAAREGAEKRWLYIDGIYIHYVLGYKLTDARWHEYQAEYGPSPFYRGVW
jgi:pyrroloquinoline-quinone synthase